MSTAAPAKETFATSLEHGNHHLLNQLCGEWEGSTKTWFEPGVVADESPMQGSITPILAGRLIQHQYQGSLQGKPFEGIAMYGYKIQTGTFQGSWIDSFHMGTEMMFAEGRKTANGFSVFGTYDCGVTEGPSWGWRTELHLSDNDTLTITAYNVSPEGEEAKATETVYTRKK